MNSISLTATGEIASELHALLRETDPVRWTDGMAAAAAERWARLRHSIDRLGAPSTQSRSSLEAALGDLAHVVREVSAEVERDPTKSYWMELRARLMPAYERLAAQLRARSLPAPTLRPTNWARIGFHVTSAVGALLLLEVLLTRRGTLWATGGFAGMCWFLETTRAASARWNDVLMRFRFFQLIIHPHEHHRVNSATWYGTALVLLAIFSPPLASATALAVLGFGDPTAGLVGRRWGRHPIAGGRTLEGSLAFVVGGTLATFAVLIGWHPVAPWTSLLGVAVVASVAGAGAELGSRRVDDNFAVPLAAAVAAAATAWLLGVPL